MPSLVPTSQISGSSSAQASSKCLTCKKPFKKLGMPKEKLCKIKNDDVNDFHLFPLPSKKRVPEARYQARLARSLNRPTRSEAKEPLPPPAPAPAPMATFLPDREAGTYKCSLRRREVIRKGNPTKYPSLDRHRRQLREQSSNKAIESQKSLPATHAASINDTTIPQNLKEEDSEQDDIEFSDVHCTKELSDFASYSSTSSASDSEESPDTTDANARMTSSELLRRLFEVTPSYTSRDRAYLKALLTEDFSMNRSCSVEIEAEKDSSGLHMKLPKSIQMSLKKRSRYLHDKLNTNAILMVIAASTAK